MAAFGAAPAAAADVCARCKHAHGEFDKCRVCQHIGRGVIFPGPEDDQPPAATLRLEVFDARSEPLAVSKGYMRLAQLLRNQVFIGELKMLKGFESEAASGRRKEVQEVDEFEAASRHVIGLIGDAPVSYARWRPMQLSAIDGPAAAGLIVIIDRFLVLPMYRKRKIGRSTLHKCVLDVVQTSKMLGVADVQRVSMFVPRDPKCAYAAQTADGLGIKARGDARAVDPTGTASPEFYAGNGVQEFSVDMATLSADYDRAMAAASGGGRGP